MKAYVLLPVTVHRPFFEPVSDITAEEGEGVSFTVTARNPAAETSGERDQAASDVTLEYSVQNLPEGASFDSSTRTFSWDNPVKDEYTVVFTADDGVIPVSVSVGISVV